MCHRLFLIGFFWLTIRYSFLGGICMLVASAFCVFLPGKLVALPLLGVLVAFWLKPPTDIGDNY